jgi:hypothetical protein
MKAAIEITELEKVVLDTISNGDEFENMPTECIENIKDSTGISTKVLRGVLSSLLQKDLILQGEYPNGMTAFHLVTNK